MRYATTEHLANWIRDAPPVDADTLLARADRVIARLDRHLLYPLDDAGEPVEWVRAALRDACCAQVEAWIDAGQTTAGGELDDLRRAGATSLKIGSLAIAVDRPRPGSGDWTTPSPAALDVLAAAGLRPHVSTR